MLAVSENGGRIRPQVRVVKSLASALCIGSGGSVGREGPIVQIGSALGSLVGQRVRAARERASGSWSRAGRRVASQRRSTRPIAGVFFGVEVILRDFAVDALFTVMLSAMVANVVAIPFLGDKSFLSGFPAAPSECEAKRAVRRPVFMTVIVAAKPQRAERGEERVRNEAYGLA